MAKEKEEGSEVLEGLSKIEHFVEEKKQLLMIGGGVVAVLAVALVYVFAKWLPERNTNAQKAMYMAEIYFAEDSFELALNGNTTYKGFKQIASDFSFTNAANLSNYYAGICCLNLKKYSDAISYLGKASISDPIVGAVRLSALGDAYAESGKFDEAVKYYEKAANFSDNDKYTPYFLYKLGLAYEKQKKNSDAKSCYEKIRNNYPDSDEGRDIEKYIARVSAGS